MNIENLESNLSLHEENVNKLTDLKILKYEEFKKLSFEKFNIFTNSTSDNINQELIKSKSLNNLSNNLNLLKKTSNEKIENDLELLKKENQKLLQSLEEFKNEEKSKSELIQNQFEKEKSELSLKLEKVTKQLENKSKELEKIVVNYAISEKQTLDNQKIKNDFEKKFKDALKDKDALMARVRGLTNDKASLMTAIDCKIDEINNFQKEIEKLKNINKEKDAHSMQLEFKLKKEQENHSELIKKNELLSEKAEKLNEELCSLKETKSSIEISEDIKNELNEKNEEIKKLNELNSNLLIENEKLKENLKTLQSDNNKFEQDKKKLNESIVELKKEFEICNDKIEQNKKVKTDYETLKKEFQEISTELLSLKNENNELVTEIKAFRQKEGELLEFTDRLQTKTIQLQSEHNFYKQKCVELESNFDKLKETIKILEEEKLDLEYQTKKIKDDHQIELNIFAKKLAEESNLKDNLVKQKDELENENRILKKKNLTSVKELNKEILILRKKVECFENNALNNKEQVNLNPSLETISVGSRTNSTNSLEPINGINIETPNNEIKENSFNLINEDPPIFIRNSNDAVQQIDKTVLLNKILSSQQLNSKLRSKIEFLEDHNQQLLEDIKKKSKIIQNFILREESGLLATNDMDKFKSTKNQVSKKGYGFMASLYKNSINDSNMTLEFSLEINRKLQAVLEDTISKNITLRENIDTLGAEIERLSKK